MKERTKKVKFDAYDYHVHLVYTKNLQKSLDARAEKLDKHKLSKTVDGLCCDHKDCQFTCYVMFDKRATLGTIAHECYHAVTNIFRTIHAEHEEELFAYHLGYLVDECVKLITKKK